MIADALKKSLLQAAIQGKLTEQLPEDGDARDLLKEIQKEKARLVKDGKIKKEKPLPEITEDEIPFDIPENWVWARLGNVIQRNLGGGTPSKANPNYWGGDIYWASVKDLNDKYLTSTQDRITEKGLLNSSSNLIPEGNIIICTRMGLGKIAINSIDVAINQDLRAIFLPEKFDKGYFFHFYSTLIFAGKGATVKGVSLDEINNTLIPLPPFAEQKRIVEKLERLLLEIETLKAEENKLDKLEKAFPGKIRASILQAAIQGKLTEQLPDDGDARALLKEIQKEKARLIKEGKIKKANPLPEITEDEIPFDVPENWVWARLGDCNEMMTGNSIPKDVKAKKYSTPGGGLPYIGTKDVSANYEIVYENGVYIPLNEPGFKTANKNSTLLCVEGGSAGRKIAMTDREVCFGNKLCKFEAFKINSKYVFYYLQTNEFGQLFKGEMTGIIGGVGIDRLKNIPICLPPLAEQERIVQELDELVPLCDALE